MGVERPMLEKRFLSVEQAAAELLTSRRRIYTLLRTGELPAIKVGGRGVWRIERRFLYAAPLDDDSGRSVMAPIRRACASTAMGRGGTDE